MESGSKSTFSYGLPQGFLIPAFTSIQWTLDNVCPYHTTSAVSEKFFVLKKKGSFINLFFITALLLFDYDEN